VSCWQMKIGDLVKPKRTSLTVDEIGEDLLGIISNYNDCLACPYEVAWLNRREGRLFYFWEIKDDLMLISSNEGGRLDTH